MTRYNNFVYLGYYVRFDPPLCPSGQSFFKLNTYNSCEHAPSNFKLSSQIPNPKSQG